jgi:hypothetical protein
MKTENNLHMKDPLTSPFGIKAEFGYTTKWDAVGAVQGYAIYLPYDDAMLIHNLTLPRSYLRHPVTEIASWGFGMNRNIQGTLVIPSSVERIGNNAFQGCTGITHLILGPRIREIGEEAFKDCRSLVANVKEFFQSLGKEFFPDNGNEFFLHMGKEFFTGLGKEFFSDSMDRGQADF